MVCNVCQVEKNESEFQKYWHSTQNKFRIRKQCSTCFYLKRKKVKLIEVPTEEEIIQPEPSVQELGPSYDETTHRVCMTCNEVKHFDEFGKYTKYPDKPRSRCRACDKIIENQRYREKIDMKGGNDRCPPKPNRYADDWQREQTFEFLQLLGWKFNQNKGIWYKDGIKTEDGVFINIKKPFNEPKPKSIKPILKRGRMLHKAWEQKDDIRKLRKEGMKFYELAMMFNASQPTIREIVYTENEEASR